MFDIGRYVLRSLLSPSLRSAWVHFQMLEICKWQWKILVNDPVHVRADVEQMGCIIVHLQVCVCTRASLIPTTLCVRAAHTPRLCSTHALINTACGLQRPLLPNSPPETHIRSVFKSATCHFKWHFHQKNSHEFYSLKMLPFRVIAALKGWIDYPREEHGAWNHPTFSPFVFKPVNPA